MFSGKVISKRINKIFNFRFNDYVDKNLILFQIKFQKLHKQFIIFDKNKYALNWFNNYIISKIDKVNNDYEFEYSLNHYYDDVIFNNQKVLYYSICCYDKFGKSTYLKTDIKDHLLFTD